MGAELTLGRERRMRYRGEVDVAGTPEEVFAYLADFSRISEWDPGIAEAHRLSDPPTVVGSRFEVVALFRQKPQRFEYVVTGYDEGSRIVLHGEGERAVSDDAITVETRNNRTCVTYEAELRLKGVLRLAEPLLGRAVQRMGDAALARLKSRLGGAG